MPLSNQNDYSGTNRVPQSFLIVGIGASAGGLNALKELMPQLNDVYAAFFIVLHVGRKSVGDFLVAIIQKLTTNFCILAEEGLEVRPHTIYFAAPDTHLLVKDNKILIGRGPAENRWRPSIDVLFRSLAVEYTSRVCGIILTGLMDDGTSGMNAIKQAGGTSIVQDPNEAEYPDMPMSVLNQVEVDYCVQLSEMAEVLKKVQSMPKPNVAAPDDLIAEASLSEKVSVNMENVKDLGVHSIFTCPDCGGGLWEITDGKIIKYRCHVGHAFTEPDLAIRSGESIESAVWIAIRMMEERRNLLLKIAERNRNKGFQKVAQLNTSNALDIEHHIRKLRDMIFSVQEDNKE